jgi:hypothetical protein
MVSPSPQIGTQLPPTESCALNIRPEAPGIDENDVKYEGNMHFWFILKF